MTWVNNATPTVNAISDYRTIIAICVVLSVLSIAVVSTRLWIRGSARGLKADDCMAALSMAFALIYSILCIVRECLGSLLLITFILIWWTEQRLSLASDYLWHYGHRRT